jgi:hypothetical protein
MGDSAYRLKRPNRSRELRARDRLLCVRPASFVFRILLSRVVVRPNHHRPLAENAHIGKLRPELTSQQQAEILRMVSKTTTQTPPPVQRPSVHDLAGHGACKD